MRLIKKNLLSILQVDKEITIKNADEFKENMEVFLDEAEKFLILDLTKVSYLNSAALGIIAHAAMNAKKSNKELVIAGVNPPISEIFEIVKFSTFMELFQTVEEAEEYYLEVL